MRLSKLAVLRLGFGGMIALLLVSAFEAYRIQQTASRQTAQIYYRFVQETDTLYRIRRALFLGSIYTRDFLLNNQKDRADTFRNQLRTLKAEADAALGQLHLAAANQQSFSGLKGNVQEFWTILESPLGWSGDVTRSRAFQFVQSEVAPRRSATGGMVRELVEASQNALQQSEAEFARSRTTAMLRLFGIMGLCLLLGLAVVYFSLRYAGKAERESLQRFEQVTQAKRDLECLSARLLEIQEDERRRLSRELHDEIGQTLTALRIEISHAQAAFKAGSPVIQARLEQARSLAEKTVETIRNISLLLRPSLLDDLGLEPALQYQVEDFSRRSGIRCSFSEEGLQETLPDALKTCVYRVVQEALNNCQKHAGATEVQLRLRQSGLTLTVQIEDNGRGFALDKSGNPASPTGMGILGMRERAAGLGGSLKLVSAPGQGTRLSFILPLAPPAPSPRMDLETAGKGA